MRFFLDISYEGTSYHGWQVQHNAHTVQGELNHVLSTLLRTPTECVGSGRTDAGVHATHQVAHFDFDKELDPDDLVYKLNSFLPDTIAINSCREVKPDAHARFDAELRSYEYHIHGFKNPFKKGLSYFFNIDLDLKLIYAACDLICGWENFQAFSKVQTDVNTFLCEIKEIKWEQTNEAYVFHVSANRFLRGMVRALVGTLLDVGQGRTSVDQLKEILNSGDRKKAGRAVPAEGLFLTRVSYPEHIYL
ncbi:tRNA pseudouridine(38-40) synthase TruA [Marinoscillum sp. MHG1-6]|uniref:tRNA pseudouridine(38-40) synthase TruA n=1 Tax=Marinoscillum sp. MHG1-6 TaxID=2959627 RepID=UPI00215816D5|nr:tRNA pseudouridine(38-40) synthase TruA [Marinoscillum sp. MHG1-6]